MKTLLPLLIAAACATTTTTGFAQDSFPSRPVKLIIPYPAGGGGDILGRAMAQAFSKSTGQAMVVENRAGANGMIGAAACKNAPPDGYTYCLPVSDVMAINPHVYKTVPYDPARDFVVVAPVATVILAFVANSSVPASNLKELAAWSQSNKDKANFATWGIGSAAHLSLTAFNKTMNGSLTNVPYPGVPQMLQATLSNDASATLLFYGPIAQYIDAGRLKPLAILGDKRYRAMPNVPTVSEQGFNFTPTVYYGVYAPTGTPAPILARMSQLIGSAAADPEVRKIMDAAGFAPLEESNQAFAERVARDRATWGPIAKSLNLALE
ncbi:MULTISPECIES: tripartite tricarboxylate transporter substrate binding protein [Comamonadaceae]|uniref:Bug family tripartite tricarboxylate transporter substrate binding protein n=1 Tax=Comamonadaceae TaxID=80864 RepID=UPI0010FA1DB1|nr:MULTISPECIES: tripartite tricarboxylate transporter substrate binding protein [Comamonadaceae]